MFSAFANLKVRAKLLVLFSTIILLTTLLAGYAINKMLESVNVADRLNFTLTQRYGRVNDAQDGIFDLHFLIEKNIVEKARNEDAIKAQLTKTKAFVDALQMKRLPKEIGAVKKNFAAYIHYYESQLKVLVEQGNYNEAYKVFYLNMEPLVVNSFFYLQEVVGTQIDESTSHSNTLASYNPIYYIIAISIIVIAYIIFMTFFISTSIDKYLKHILENVQYMASSDLSHEVKTHTTDEFGILSRNLETMRKNLATKLENIINVVGTLNKESNDLLKSTEHINELAKNCENRAITVAAATDEMTSTTADIAKNCHEASIATERSREITQEGVQSVGETVNGIYSQVDQTKKDADHIATLLTQAQNIGSIVNTIEEIAAQTNLLALNAAIEAARAGEAGRGFAVVADEVRALASRTSSSTQEISNMVNGIQHDANLASESMALSVNNMDTVAQGASKVQDILENIIENAQNVNTQVAQIATAAEEQTAATNEISTNMQEVTSIAQDVSSSSTQNNSFVLKASASLDEVVADLSEFKFK